MQTYISLLRGINVGKKQLPMKDLKALYESLGFREVQTYIQSGNVLFKYKKARAEQLSQLIEKKIEDVFGFGVRVLNLTIPQLEEVIKANPFDRELGGTEKVYVAFLITPVSDETRLQKLMEMDFSPDKFVVTGSAIYIYCDKGYGTTKINNNFFEAKLKVAATTRNWSTTIKLKELAADLDK